MHSEPFQVYPVAQQPPLFEHVLPLGQLPHSKTWPQLFVKEPQCCELLHCVAVGTHARTTTAYCM